MASQLSTSQSAMEPRWAFSMRQRSMSPLIFQSLHQSIVFGLWLEALIQEAGRFDTNSRLGNANKR